MVSPNASPANASPRTVLIRIRRQATPDAAPRWEEFRVPIETGSNVISSLQWIAANPKTSDGKDSAPVAYDSGCLEEVCGSCTMVINGTVRQACSALVENVMDATGTITLEPMSKFPCLKDLSVDRSRLFHNLKRVKAWVPIDGLYDLGAGPKETPDRQETRYALSTCMSCACCLEACPQFNPEKDPAEWDRSFVGAAVISQARLFNMHETGRELKSDRLEVLMGPGGVNDCGNAQNCVKVCPKEIPLGESIAAIGREATVEGVKKFFSGR
jgi:succinate dehydrogenase / fumarate reductase iron-sulfur subunit